MASPTPPAAPRREWAPPQHTVRQVESTLKVKLEDHRVALEQKVDEDVRRCEESSFRRAEELFAPQTRDLRAHLEAELPMLRQRIEHVFKLHQEETVNIREKLTKDVESLNIEVGGIHMSMPQLRTQVQLHAESIKMFDEFPKALRSEVSELRDEFRREITNLRADLENEIRHAEGERAANMRELQGKIAATVQTADDSAQKQAEMALHSVGCMEQHLLFRIEEIREFATLEAKKRAEEGSLRLRPEILEARDLMQQRLDECLEKMDVKAMAVQAQLRGEIAAEVGNLAEKLQRSAELRVAEVSLNLSEGMETARRDLRGQAGKQQEMTRRWKEEFQQAMERLDNVASAARMSSAEVHNHASKQLAVARAQLRDDFAKERRITEQAITAVRTDLNTKAVHIEMVELSDATQAIAERADRRVTLLETHYDGTKAWLEKESAALRQSCNGAQSEAAVIKQRAYRENAALGDELSRVRAATTSLTHGVLRALQIFGLLNDFPQPTQETMRTTRWGVDVEDLVTWEKEGHSLADRIAEEWRVCAPGNVATLLEALHRKADQGELKMVRHTLNMREMSSPASGRKSSDNRRTPSTAAGFSEASPAPFPSVSPDNMRSMTSMTGNLDGFISPFSASPPNATGQGLPSMMPNTRPGTCTF